MVPPDGGARGRDGLDQGRFALAVGAQDADALAGQHRAVHAAHDDRGRRRSLG